jgi:hypothetical protein
MRQETFKQAQNILAKIAELEYIKSSLSCALQEDTDLKVIYSKSSLNIVTYNSDIDKYVTETVNLNDVVSLDLVNYLKNKIELELISLEALFGGLRD